jgi:hypothetical protein
MTKGLWIYLVILLLIAAVVDVLIIKTDYLPLSTTQNFSTTNYRDIFVDSSAGLIDVTTASEGYYRIKSGDVTVEGEYIVGDYFQNTAKLPVGQWVIEDCESTISFKVVSPTPITVVLVSTTAAIILTITISLFLSVLLFVFGWILASD